MRRPYMEDPYAELAGAIYRLKDEIVELTGAVLHLLEVIKDARS